MADVPALWVSTARKEAMDLLEKVWTGLDERGRDALSAALVEGPPAHLLESIEESERASSRDRRIFDRIVILDRCGEPPLTPSLRAELERLEQAYPHWRALEGERARFSSWMEFRWGPDTNFSQEDLIAQDDPVLLQTLVGESDKREGVLEAWRQLALDDPERALSLLENLSSREDKGPSDVWEYGLWGLRDSPKAAPLLGRVLALLVAMPDEPFAQPEFSSAIADVLQTASRAIAGSPDVTAFWHLFDRTLAAAGQDPQNLNRAPDEEEEGAGRPDWVSFALNCSMGRLAGAFFDVLFARRLTVDTGIPTDLRDRLDRLMGYRRPEHRPARVIAASRIAYLFAIDPSWSQTLLAEFRWQDEDESIALWQGYAWQARIDVQLWGALKPGFLPLFTADRLKRLGERRRNMAHLLMLVGIEFAPDELARDDTRNAIRAMSPEMKVQALAWIVAYLEQRWEDDPETETSLGPDELWRERVAPWLKRVWPPEPAMRAPEVSEQFALAAIATEEAFGEAVAAVRPYLMPSNAFQVLWKLDESSHPDARPQEVLQLLDAVVAPNAPRLGDRHLGQIVHRIGAAGGRIETDRLYIRWREFVERDARKI